VRRGAIPRGCSQLGIAAGVEGVATVCVHTGTRLVPDLLRRLENAESTAQALSEPLKQNNRVKLPQFDLRVGRLKRGAIKAIRSTPETKALTSPRASQRHARTPPRDKCAARRHLDPRW
jgi:hypothetical protein